MSDRVLALRVAARFQLRADQASGKRQDARRNTTPINLPVSVDKGIVHEQGLSEHTLNDDMIEPNHKDIRPQDVFSPQPSNVNVLNLAQTGRDQAKGLREKVPKDKGWDTVKNLSQYLIRTEGGGGTKPAGK